MMTALDIGKELVALCRQGKNMDAIERLYSPTIESVEPIAHPQIGQVQKGVDTVKGKNQWWIDNHEVHKVEVNGPFPNGDQFIVHFTYDVTPKHTGKRMTMSEMGLFTVQQEKITKEVFFYRCKNDASCIFPKGELYASSHPSEGYASRFADDPLQYLPRFEKARRGD